MHFEAHTVTSREIFPLLLKGPSLRGNSKHTVALGLTKAINDSTDSFPPSLYRFARPPGQVQGHSITFGVFKPFSDSKLHRRSSLPLIG